MTTPSRVSAVLNNTQVEIVGGVVKNAYGLQIQGKFKWNLASRLPLYVNNRWGIRCGRVHLASDTLGNVRKNPYFAMSLASGPLKSMTFDLIDYAARIDDPHQLVNLLTDLIPEELRKAGHLYINIDEHQIVKLTVGADDRMILGNKIATALGLKEFATFEGSVTSLFTTGSFQSKTPVTRDDVMSALGSIKVVYVALDVIKSSLFGASFEPIVKTVNPGGNDMGTSAVFHDLIQSPLTNCIVSFLDEKGELIHFCPTYEDDFLWALELEFKRNTIM